MKKIKILYTIPNFDTAGSGKALLNIAKGLDKDLFEPHIMCLHDRGEFFKTVKSSGIPVHVFNYISEARPITKLVTSSWRVSRKFKEINPDIIHSFHYAPDYTEALAAKMANINWVFTKKNMNWGGASKNAWKVRSFLAEKIAVQNTDMIKQFYPDNKKTVLIPRGVNIEHFRSSVYRNESNNSLFFPKNQRLLICVANFVPVKGIEILIEGFDRLKEEYPNWSLLLVGDDTNDYGIKLHKLVSELKLEDRIKFTGKLLDIRPELNRSEIYVLPTLNKGRREGSPVAILEAMANGKVVLGSRIPGIKDQLAELPELLFEAGNVDQLYSKLNFFMKISKEELKEKGDDIFQHVKSNFTIEKEIRNHENLYKSIT